MSSNAPWRVSRVPPLLIYSLTKMNFLWMIVQFSSNKIVVCLSCIINLYLFYLVFKSLQWCSRLRSCWRKTCKRASPSLLWSWYGLVLVSYHSSEMYFKLVFAIQWILIIAYKGWLLLLSFDLNFLEIIVGWLLIIFLKKSFRLDEAKYVSGVKHLWPVVLPITLAFNILLIIL